MADNTVEILIRAQDEASGPLRNVGAAANETGGHFNALSGLGSALTGVLGNIAQTAAGVVTGFIAFNALQFPEHLITEALQAYSAYERLGLSYQAMIAVQLQEASGTEEMVVSGQKRIELNDKEAKQLANLQEQLQEAIAKRGEMSAASEGDAQKQARIERDRQLAIASTSEEIKKQTLQLEVLTKKWGTNGIDTQLAADKLQGLRNKLADLQNPINTHALAIDKTSAAYQKNEAEIGKLQGQIDKLQGKNGALVDVMEKVRTGQMSMNEAMDQAGPIAQELVRWTERMAIFSPFGEEVPQKFEQYLLGANMALDATKDLTKSMMDWGAATGRTPAQMEMIAHALSQVQAAGKLTGFEVRELSRDGMTYELMAKAAGVSTEEFRKKMADGAIAAGPWLEQLAKLSEARFPDAADKQAHSWAGLLTSLNQIKNVGLRDFFEGTFKAIQPLAANLVDTLGSDEMMDRIRGFGEVMGGKLKDVLTWLKDEGLPATIKGFTAIRDIAGELPGLWTNVADAFGNAASTLKGVSDWANSTAQNLGTLNDVASKKAVPSGNELAWTWGETAKAFQNSGKDIETLARLLQGLGAVVGGLLAVLEVFFLSLATGLKNALESALVGLARFAAAFLAQWGALGDILLANWDFVTGAIVNITQGNWSAMQELMETFNQRIQSDTTQFLRSVYDQFTAFFITLLGAAYGFVSGFVTTMVKGFQDLYDQLVGHSLVWELHDKIVEIMSRLPGEMEQIGRDMINGIINGLAGLYQALYDSLWNAVSWALNALKASLGIASPSRLMAEIGNNMVLGFHMGVKGGFGDQPSLLPASNYNSHSSYAYSSQNNYGNQWNVTVNSAQPSESILYDMAILRAMAGDR